jgi:hypothetical protein
MAREAFCPLFFRVSGEEDAPVYVGRLIVIGGEPWLFLSDADVPRLPLLRPQMLLDPSLLVERHDAAIGGQYFFYLGPIPPVQKEPETPQ